MRSFIVGDSLAISEDCCAILKRHGCVCRDEDQVSLGYGAEFLAHARRDVIVLVMSPDAQRALEVLRELKTISAAPILAVGLVDDPKFVLQVLREGAVEYLDENELEEELDNSLVRMKNRRGPLIQRGRVIGVLSPSGGGGASSVVANLAHILAKEHEKAAVFDLCLAAGDQALLMDLNPSHTLAELCGKLNRLDANMLQQCLVRHQCGVQLLAAPASFETVSLVSSQGVRQALQLARTMFPYVVVDLDRSFGTEQMSAIVHADIVLLVMQLNLISLCSTTRVINHLDDLGISHERIRVVVNRFHQPKELPVAKAKQALGIDILHLLPNDPAGMNMATNAGVPVVTYRPRAKISRSFWKLAEKVEAACLPAEHHGHQTAENPAAPGAQLRFESIELTT